MAVKRLFQFRPTFLDSSGNLASGYRLFFYAAGTTSKQSTYNSSAGTTPNTNPIVLNSLGQPAVEVWGTTGLSYKLALAAAGSDDPPGAFIWTEDNVSPINDVSSELSLDQWLPSGLTPTYISSTSFSVPGDKTADFVAGRRLKSAVNGGTAYSTVVSSAFASVTTVTVVNDGTALDAGMNSVSWGIVTPTNSSLPWLVDSTTTFVDNSDPTKKLVHQLSGITTATTRTATWPDASITVAGRDNTETLTNKTLTSPAINTGTLTSPVINTGISGTAIATKTQYEAANSTALIGTPQNQIYHPAHPKAWVRFAGSDGTIAASYGVDDITKNSTGNYTVNFTTAFSSTSYCAIVTQSSVSSGSQAVHTFTYATDSFQFITVYESPDGTTAVVDPTYVNCVFFGDQ